MKTIIEPFRIMFRRDESYAGSPSFVPLVGSARTLAPFWHVISTQHGRANRVHSFDLDGGGRDRSPACLAVLPHTPSVL